jgi:hypothetical protein
MNKRQRPGYYIETYDAVKETYTPHRGVRTGPWTLFGLRKAIRKLRAGGYPCNYQSRNLCCGCDPSVSIYRVD